MLSLVWPLCLHAGPQTPDSRLFQHGSDPTPSNPTLSCLPTRLQFLPWAVRAAARAPDLMCIYYEQHFGEPLEELRLRWRIEVAPSAPQNTQKAARQRAAEPAAEPAAV